MPEELAYADADMSIQESAEPAQTRQAFTEEQIKTVFANWAQVQTLTQREAEVLKFVLEKRRRRDIAQVLFVTESTIKKHTSNVYKKLEVTNRTELFEKASVYVSK